MSTTYKGEQWLTVEAAADYIGVSTIDVIRQIRDGVLRATWINDRLYVSLRSARLHRFRSKPRGLLERILE